MSVDSIGWVSVGVVGSTMDDSGDMSSVPCFFFKLNRRGVPFLTALLCAVLGGLDR